MTYWIISTLIGVVVVGGCLIGIIEGFRDGSLPEELSEWPNKTRWEHKRKMYKRLPPDRHSQARQDGDFVDGIITGHVLDELGDWFK